MTDWKEITSVIHQMPEMAEVKKKVKAKRETEIVLPHTQDIFNCFNYCPYDKLKIVIVGQDPYPAAKHANGLAFSSSSNEAPGSLKNIFKEIHRDLYPNDNLNDCFTSNDLVGWASQGVLLLNRVLTVKENEPGSHEDIGWQFFTERILHHLNEDYPKPLVFMFWGKKSQQSRPIITSARHLILETSHPSNKSVDMGFNGCGHFSQANEFLRNDFYEQLSEKVMEYTNLSMIAKYTAAFFQKQGINIVDEKQMDQTAAFYFKMYGPYHEHLIPGLFERYGIDFKT